MANYTPTFTKPYPSGWVDKPSKTTPVTAAIMNSYDTAIAALEAYLRDNAIDDTVSVSVEQFPSDGRQWLGTITVGNNQYRIYMPSLKYENSVSDGVKIGAITLGEQSFDVYAPKSSAGGSTVSVVPKTLTGTNIAEITVDGTTYQLYAPTGGGSGSTVTAEATLTEGTEIGKITIDGKEIILYAPQTSSITVDSELSATSENAIQNKVVKVEFDKVDSSLTALGKCKNLLDTSELETNKPYTHNGVTFVRNVDGTITANGTAIDSGSYIQFIISLNGKYKICGSPKIANTLTQVFANGSWHNEYQGDGEIVNGNISRYAIKVESGNTVKNVVFKPMITENLNATYDDFVPYTGGGDTLTADVAKINSDVSNLKDGTTPVAKAVADEDGNSIKSIYAKKTETSETVTEDVNVVLNSDLFDSTYSDITCIRIGKLCVLSFTIRAKNTISSTLDKIVLMSIIGTKYQPKKLGASTGRRQIFQGFAVGNYDENGKQSQSLNNTVRIITDWDNNYTEIITRDKDRLNWSGYVQGQIMWVTD